MKTINATMDMLTVLLMLFYGICIGGDSIVVCTALIQEGSVAPQLLVVVFFVVFFWGGGPSAHKYNLKKIVDTVKTEGFVEWLLFVRSSF